MYYLVRSYATYTTLATVERGTSLISRGSAKGTMGGALVARGSARTIPKTNRDCSQFYVILDRSKVESFKSFTYSKLLPKFLTNSLTSLLL